LGLEQGGASAGRPAERNKLERGASLSKPIKVAGFIPRSRLEALTDGVFAFAMTLLVVNIELPEGFHPKSNQEFLERLSGLSDTFVAYLITFFVLVSFWFGRAKETGEPEMSSAAYAWAVLLHLLSVTFLPFSMLAVGRYDLPAAVWIYNANMILLALTASLSRSSPNGIAVARACKTDVSNSAS
jgi:uncharacterized membrane protein